MQWLGVDVGGTFTDLVLYDESTGKLALLKTASTPHDHSEGMINGVDRLGIELKQLAKFAHGTTVATNTALERNGARTAVLTTRGHRDVLVVGRGNRTILYNIKAQRPEPLVARSDIHEVDERALADGTVRRPLDEREIGALAKALAADGVEAVAICFLHAYAAPGNEAAARERVRAALPGAFVCTSAEVLPEYREYERFATTALNAYVAPRMRRYLANLRDKLATRGYERGVTIMASNGGTLPSATVEALPVSSMLSGPAAGVIAASVVGEAAGFRDIITCDMGGTSTDVCLLQGGAFAMTTEGSVGALPNRVLQIDINSIGAGGGSIAQVDEAGFLAVGPRSAGAMPGPAAYGRGGTEATVTDANVVLGRLGTDAPLGGEICLDRARAEAAVTAQAARLGLDTLAMAEGILRIASVKMTGAIKEISVMRGHDPRDFALFAYGGAGPLHAAFIAEELGMGRVVVPPMPGNFSAFGLLVADVRRDFVRTQVTRTAGLGVAGIRAILAEMRDEAGSALAEAGFGRDRQRFEARLDMRYAGQSFELAVPVAFDIASIDEIERGFREVYEARYSHATDDPSEIVSYRVAGYGIVEKPALPRIEGAGRSLEAALKGRRPVGFGGKAVETPVYDRDRLPPEERVPGPAIVEEGGSTTVVPPGFTGRLDAIGCLILERVVAA
jgi:N-methylhydantoinase A